MDNRIKRLMAYYLKMSRLMRGFTQQDVADRLQKSTNAISNWELGNTSPPIDDLVQMCKMYGLSPNELIGWDPCPELEEYIKKSENAEELLNDLKQQRKALDDQIKQITDIVNRKH